MLEPARSGEPVPRPPGRPPPLVSLSPALRGRPASASRGRATRPRAAPAAPGEPCGSRRTAMRRRPCATPWRPGTTARAAGLIERAGPAMRSSRQEARPARLARRPCPKTIIASPACARASNYAGALLSLGRARQDPRRACRLRNAGLMPRRVVPRDRRPSSPSGSSSTRTSSGGCRARSQIYRAAQAMAIGDVAGTIRHARARARARRDRRSPDPRIGRRASRARVLGARRARADAYRSWTECDANLEKAGHIADMSGTALAMADIRVTQGRLRDAMGSYERGLRHACRTGPPGPPRSSRHARRHCRPPGRARRDGCGAEPSSSAAGSSASTSDSPRTRTAGMS